MDPCCRGAAARKVDGKSKERVKDSLQMGVVGLRDRPLKRVKQGGSKSEAPLNTNST